MKDVRQRVAYLQGLMAGLDIEAESKEGKIFKGILDVLEEVADSLTELQDSMAELEDYLENVDEDLLNLEDEIYDYDDDDDEADELNDLVDLDEGDADYVEVECPECHDLVSFDADILEDDTVIEVTCPNCTTVVFVNEDEDSVAATTREGNAGDEDEDI